MSGTLMIQAFVLGAWRDAGRIIVSDTSLGHQGPSRTDYEMDYVLSVDPYFNGIAGNAAFSVNQPLGLERWSFDTWPPFLLDFLPQGHARKVLLELLGFKDASNTNDFALLLRAGGSPIGNLRVKEAWEDERKRVAEIGSIGLTAKQIYRRDDRFAEMAREFAAVASGSSGVQGAWPKLLLTRHRSGHWLPDPCVEDGDATDHAIIKWVGDRDDRTSLILAAEAPYLEVARYFGLRCGRPLEHRDGMLFIPRFDRRVTAGQVERLGQESIVSAAGVADFGHLASHEDYLDVLKQNCDNPAAEVAEYVLRDVLNLAMGNPDNHGRNTALQKDVDGTTRLTPLYDFCPMRLDPTIIPRSTTWRCLRQFLGRSRDLDPDWSVVCDIAADGVLDATELKRLLASKAEILRELPEKARLLNVPEKVVDQAMARCPEIARSLDALARSPLHGPR